ncbi:filamentous hemagglutinin N-terminal domain-containing protein, partial [Frateuria defendens]|uniref:two-partner secretion domain-containing protein n=1 Tax=Frateuria defendens TaxID=2219559 RepID=UPI00066FD3CE
MMDTRRSHSSRRAANPAGGARWPRTLQRQLLWTAVTLALGLPAAHAQVHPDGSTQTATLAASNGVPVVNIAAPNGAGLSHNRYQQFDVGTQGLILNNSSQLSQTQLAGYVYGNPNLSGSTAARLILNEVTGTQRSQLGGALEVAGQRAEVIVANPNGIDCTGCGFINASRGVLTTGRPVLGSDGSLQALNVAGGTITVNGQGLDGSGIDRVDLIARAVSVNAGVWARQLNVVTGANRVDYNSLATAPIAAEGDKPAVALDVSALGGMYAGVIRLVGTEAGLGINNRGEIAAQSGDLTLTSAGDVVLAGRTTATGSVTVGALQSVSHTGTVAAGAAVNVHAGGDLTSGGVLYSGGPMTLSAGGQFANRGQVQAQGGALTLQAGAAAVNGQGATVYAGGPLALSAASLSNAGTLESAQGFNLYLGGDVDNSGVLQADGGDLAFSGVAHATNGGSLSAAGDVALMAAQSLRSTGSMVAGGNVSLGGSDLTTAGIVQAGKALSLSGGSLSNSGKLYALGGDGTVTLTGALTSAGSGDLYSVGTWTMNAASFTNAGAVEAKQALSLSSGGDISNTGTLQADNGDLSLRGGGSLGNRGTLSATGNLTLSTGRALSSTGQAVATGNVSLEGADLATGGVVQAGQALNLRAHGALTNAGKLHALGGGWTAQVDGSFGNQGTGDLYGSGDVVLKAASLTQAGTLEATHSATLGIGGALANTGVVQADQGDIALTAGSLDNAGTFSATRALGATVGTQASNSGTLVSGAGLSLAAGHLINAATGQVQSGTDLHVQAAALDNGGSLYAKGSGYAGGGDFNNLAGAQWLADGALTLDNTGAVSNAGVLQAGSDLALGHAASLSNVAGATVYAGHDLDLALSQALSNAGLLYAAHAATLAAGRVDNPGILRSGGTLAVSSAGDMSSSGAIQAQQTLDLSSGGALTSSGKLYAIDGPFTAHATGNFTSSSGGDLYSGGDIAITAGAFANAGTLEAKSGAAITAGTGLSNSGAMQADNGDLDLAAATLDNEGALSGTGALSLSGTQSLSNAGTAVSGQAMRLTTASLVNSGQMQGGGDVVVQAAAVDNSGRVQAGAALSLSGNQTLLNRTTGQWLAAGGISADTANQLTNAGVVQAGGNLSVAGQGSLDNQAGGTLYGAQQATFQLGGGLTNAGTVYGAQGVNLTLASLDNGGTVRSGAAMNAAIAAAAGNSGNVYALGNLFWHLGGALTNAGVLAAAGNASVQAGSLDGAGTLAAGLQADGTLGTSGDLGVTVAGALGSHGRMLAGNGLTLRGSAIDLSGSQTRAGGHAGLTATQGDVDNRGGDFAANGTLTLNAAGALLNGGTVTAQGGRLSAGTLSLGITRLDNRYGNLLQSGGGDLGVNLAGAFDNAHGNFAVNAGNLTLGAASLDNSAGTIQHAGTGTLRLTAGGDLLNTGGRIAGNGALAANAGGNLDNSAGGSIGMAGDVTLAAGALNNSGGTLNNSGGTLAARNVGLSVTGAATNAGGTVQAGGTLTATLGTLDNRSGFFKVTGNQALGLTTAGALSNAGNGFIGGNGDVSVHAGSLLNAGQIYAGRALDAEANGPLTNDNGALQALSHLHVRSGSTLSNRQGRLEAGAGNGAATLDVNAASLDNTGGRLANAGAGATTVAAGRGIANQGGTLGGQGNVSLSAGSLDNSGTGHLVAGQDLTLVLGGMNNAGGTAYAARQLGWSNRGASLTNTAGGAISAGGDVSLALAQLNNDGGDLGANGNIGLDLGSLLGNGRAVAGQDLSLSLSGGYTNGSGSQIKANRDLTLSLGGDFSNPSGATLEAVRHLTINAGNITNAAGATLNSAGTALNARGSLSNAGRVEGDTLTLNAPTISNTGTLIGGAITATAGNFTNGADLGQATGNPAYQGALVAATDSISLYVSGTLLNRDATLFTLGNLTMAADAAGHRSAAVMNRSGDIEADGSIYLAANQFTNERRVFETQLYQLSAAEQALNSYTEGSVKRYRYDDGDPTHQPPYVDASQVVGASEVAQADAYCVTHDSDSSSRCVGYRSGSGTASSFQGTSTDTVLTQTLLSRSSARSQLLAGGDITISGSVLNDKSAIAAGHNLIVNGQDGNGGGGAVGGETVSNIAWTPTVTVGRNTVAQVEFEHLIHDPRRWVGGDFQTYGSTQSSYEMKLAQAQGLFGALRGSDAADAVMSAGDTVAITAHTIDNVVVGADGQPVHSVIGLGGNSGSQSVGGGAVGAVGAVAGGTGNVGGVALGQAPGATSGGSLDLAQGRTVAGHGAGPGTAGAKDTGPLGAGSRTGTPMSAPQVVAGLGGPNPTVGLPQSGLYTVHSEPSSPYLVETDPRFTSYTQFISSDYLLEKLDYAPDNVRKRLGDGFYEERQVLDQITSLTGRRFLSDNTDALSQYRDLMNNGAQAAQQFSLSVGVALTPEQMASLTQDMVWLVSVNVDGQQVLTPVVYLSAEHAKALAAGGATIAGKNVILTASGDITNHGTIAASQDAQLTASNLLNSGTLSAGNNLSVTAAQDILNGGTLSAGGNVSLVAGNDVRSGVSVAQQLGTVNLGNLSGPVSTVALTTLQPGRITAGGDLGLSAGRDLSLDAAPVAAGGSLALAAGRDLTATATAISAGRDAQLVAGRDLSLAATGRTVGQGGVKDGTEHTTHTVSTLTAGGVVAVAAGRDLSGQGAQIQGEAIGLGAGRDLALTAVTDTARSASQTVQGHTVIDTRTLDQTVRGATLAGMNGVTLSAGRDAALTASTLGSDKGAVTVAAGRDVTLNAATETHRWEQDTKKTTSGFLSSKTTKTHDATSDSYAVGSTLSGNAVSVAAGHDLTATAAQLTAGQALVLSAGHDVALNAGEQTHSEAHSQSVSQSRFFNTSATRFGAVDPEASRRDDSHSLAQTWS